MPTSLLIWLLPLIAGGVRAEDPAAGAFAAFREAEAAEMALEHTRELEKLAEGLEALARTPPGRRTGLWLGETELALRRLHRVASEGAGWRAARPTFERWMDREVAGEANLAALARHYAGNAALASGGGPEEARRIWEPLGFLGGFQVAGPFENERGGGFANEYEPETEGREAAGKGRLYRPDPQKSYRGKVRPVSWRKLPAVPLGGRIDLDELFRPNDEALGYCLTFIESESEQPAALRLGSDDGLKAWVNGEPVLSRDVRRPLGFDQDAASIVLRKGWNSLLLKAAGSKGSWQLLCRITAPDGAPLAGWREGEPSADAVFSPAVSSPPAPPALGARDALKNAIAPPAASPQPPAGEESDAGRAPYLLGSILLDVRAHDDGEHPDRELLRQAISLSRGPVPPIYHHTLALTCLRDSSITAERDDNDWREALEAALLDEPPSLRAALDLSRYYLESFGNLSRAESWLGRVLEKRPDLPEAILVRAEIEKRRKFPLSQTRALDALAAALGATAKKGEDGLPPLFDSEAVRRLAGRKETAGDLDGAERLLTELLGRDRFDDQARRRLAALLLGRGRVDDGLRLHRERAALAPFSTGAHTALARVLEGLDRTGEAVAEIDAALRIAPEDHEVLFQRGKMLLRAGRKEDAYRSWDQALAIQPNFPTLREYADFARRNREQFAERYRRDVSSLVREGLERPLAGDDPVQVLLDLTAVRVNPDGTVKEFRQYVARAINDQGLRTLSRWAVPYTLGEQRVEYKAARVHRKGGGVEEARLSVHGDASEDDGGRRLARIDLPPVATGDVVEVQLTIEDLQQSFFGDYFGRKESLRDEYPMAERTFILEAPANRKLHFHQKNLDLAPVVRPDEAAGTVVYTWTLRDVEAQRLEPGMPPPEEIDPLIEVSTFESWEAFGRWYWNLIRHQFELSPPISVKVEELTSGRRTEEEKIRAIYDFVTGEIRYNAWEFGVHGFKPYNAAAIFQRRFGDCKDKATLLCTMLGAAGIRAQPVLINAMGNRHEEDLTMPMVDHFNHCIAYVPPAGGRPALYLDGTAEHNAVDELPLMDRGAKVVLIREGGADVAQIPWNSSGEQGLEEEIQAGIEPDLSATLRLKGRARGDDASDLRAYFEVEGRRRFELEKLLGSRFAGAAVEAERFSNLRDRSVPVEFEVTLKAPGFVARAPEGEAIQVLDDFFESSRKYAAMGALEERRHDLLLGPPWRSKLRVVYLLPAGFRVRSVPADREVSGRFGSLSVRYRRSEEGGRAAVTMDRVFETTASRVLKADYPEFRELATALARLKDERIVMERIP